MSHYPGNHKSKLGIRFTMAQKSKFEKALFAVQVAANDSLETSMMYKLEFRFTNIDLLTIWIDGITLKEFNFIIHHLVKQQWCLATTNGVLTENNEWATITDVDIILRWRSQ